MAVAKRQRKGKARKNRTKEGLRTSGKTNNTLGWPNLHRTDPGRDKHIKRGAKASSLFLSPCPPSPHLELGRSSFWIDVSSRLRDGFSFYLLNKIEL